MVRQAFLFYFSHLLAERTVITVKKSLLFILLVAITATIVFVSVIAICNYAEAEAKTFAAATKIVQRKALRLMHEAQDERNLQKLQWARYQYNNAERIVLNFGADAIMAKEKSR